MAIQLQKKNLFRGNDQIVNSGIFLFCLVQSEVLNMPYHHVIKHIFVVIVSCIAYVCPDV